MIERIYLHKNFYGFAFLLNDGKKLIDSSGNHFDEDEYSLEDILEDYICFHDLNLTALYKDLSLLHDKYPDKAQYEWIRIGSILNTSIKSEKTNESLCIIDSVFVTHNPMTQLEEFSKFHIVNMAGEQYQVPIENCKDYVYEVLDEGILKMDFILFMVGAFDLTGTDIYTYMRAK